jgi:hypothetical protein
MRIQFSRWCRPCQVRSTVLVLALLSLPIPVSAQINGNVSVIADVMPDVDGAAGQQPVSELRTRVFLERRDTLGDHLRLNLSGYVEGLVADRSHTGATAVERTAIVRPGDLYLEFMARRFDVRVGGSRIVWGRLDEFQPTDVVNPIDLSRFLLEGRSEARLPVALARGRIFLPRSSTLEAILVPAFRAGRFDQLAESTSPFNLTPAGGFDVSRRQPEIAARNMQGGARFTSTAGRVDWAVSAYRGFRAFPTLTLVPTFAPPPLVIETFPRYTMIGGDFETVHGAWGVRGEVAAFVDDELQSTQLARGVPGTSVDGGVGLDRKAGDYRVAGNLLWSYRHTDDIRAAEVNRTDVSVVVAADRSFARETRMLRVFAIHTPTDDTTFARVIGSASLRDNVWVEGSAGIFSGTSTNIIGRLATRDFLYARLKVFF